MPASEIKLLIIDDDLVDRLTIQRSLAKANINCLIDMAGKGNQGLSLLKEKTYDCIFIDYLLPDTNGVNLLREIRAKEIDTPVIIVTSHGDERVAVDAIKSGASEYISKNMLTPEGISYSLRTAIKLADIERERKAAEAALLQSKNRLKEAQRLAKLGHWEYNLKTNKVIWSEEIFNIFELPEQTEPDYDDYLKIVHPSDQELRKLVFTKSLETKTPYQLDFRIITPSGVTKYIASYGTPVINEHGETTGMVGTVQDISDRISTQKALQESEERYRMLIETMNEGVVHVDNEQNILFANQRFCELMGYAKEEVVGSSIYIFTPDEQNKKIIDEKNTLRKQNISDQYEIQFARKDGQIIHFLVGVNPLLNPDGQVIGSLGTFTDITQRKKIEEALSSREKLLSTLFENAQSFICTHRLDGSILSINKAGANILGVFPTDLLGRSLAEFMEGQQVKQFNTYLQHIQENKHASGLFPFYNRQNNSRHYLLFRNVLYQETDKEEYIIVTAQDITDRIHFEKELTKAKLVAEKSVKVKELFLANMSHEIRTPMNGIIGLTGVLLKMVHDEEQKSFLQAIQASADKLLVIINDILDFSKIDAGKIDFEETDFNPKELLRESVQLFEASAQQKNNKINVNILANVPANVKGDPGKLTQVINNLLSNAVKFTEGGQINLSAELYEENEHTTWLQFTVQDSGIGIPEDKLISIFESFTQASNDTSRKYGGTGLGLTISKQFVELQGGSIEVQSNLGQGSTFRFKLPFKKTEARTAQPPQTKPEAPAYLSAELGALRLLLAEDNEINQILVKKVVGDWGFALDVAENGLQALELFNQNAYDLILMDMQMPEMDGFEAIDYIRKSKTAACKVPIIALTAHASQNEIQKCLQAGADAYVLKPFKSDNLLQEIAALLHRNPDFKPKFPALTPEASSQQYINLDFLKEMANGDNNFVQDICSMFIQQTPGNLEQLLNLAKEEKWPDAKALAHKMKSSVVLIGNKELETICQDIQKYALLPTQRHLILPMILRAKVIFEKAAAELKLELKTP
ncbi:response regulator [Adhaeribacter rhizoryzae]|uniref:histidine kinase n=1 Tax=Adhaeribacter rhizoryzae TaxID=2607907 RepID=A0A5M6DEN7_9BACT|nr:response regulator [Adhaeribacter rhizoryzae]KAA5544762.1 response regulator [Adhaeribacter rhizoryzae]